MNIVVEYIVFNIYIDGIGFSILKIFLDLISADTPFGQLKLTEVGAWFGRRNKNPRALVGAVSRGKM